MYNFAKRSGAFVQKSVINFPDQCNLILQKSFRYLGTTITNQNLIQGEIKKRLNLSNACYHSF
jgi:hypothetical protein